MKSIGLIGGISWHATSKYYSFINQAINNHFGDNTNPPLMIYNMNQSKMHEFQKKDDWVAISDMVYEGAKSLLDAGTELILICSNTTHKVFKSIHDKISTPILHIGDATAQHIIDKGFNKVGFIGTKFTMENKFLVDRIRGFDIDVLVPEESTVIKELHRIIHEELTYKKILPKSKDFVRNEIQKMKDQGAEGIILGCTEFSLMFEEMKLDLPVFDTVDIHAQGAVDYILEGVGY